MARHITTGIDIGTHYVRVIVAERTSSGKRILGMGIAGSKGLRHGYIINSHEVGKSIRDAVMQAEKASGTSIKSAYLSMGGVSVEGAIVKGSTVTSRADERITDLDVERAIEAAIDAMPKSASQNRKILHQIPLNYRIDGKEVLGQPAGMKGVKLEVRLQLITCLEQHLSDLEHAVEEIGIEVINVIASPLAAGTVNLTKAQRIAGVVLADIGSETVSVVVYENNIPISLKIFPLGSTDITNDIALGLKVPLEEAESIKIGEAEEDNYPNKKLEKIVMARLKDILELIDAHLEKIGKNELLPAGIVLTGGGSGITNIEDLAKATLSLPSQTAELNISSSNGPIRDPGWSVAYGLAMIGLATSKERISGLALTRGATSSILSWLKKFLP